MRIIETEHIPHGEQYATELYWAEWHWFWKWLYRVLGLKRPTRHIIRAWSRPVYRQQILALNNTLFMSAAQRRDLEQRVNIRAKYGLAPTYIYEGLPDKSSWVRSAFESAPKNRVRRVEWPDLSTGRADDAIAKVEFAATLEEQATAALLNREKSAVMAAMYGGCKRHR